MDDPNNVEIPFQLAREANSSISYPTCPSDFTVGNRNTGKQTLLGDKMSLCHRG